MVSDEEELEDADLLHNGQPHRGMSASFEQVRYPCPAVGWRGSFGAYTAGNFGRLGDRQQKFYDVS